MLSFKIVNNLENVEDKKLRNIKIPNTYIMYLIFIYFKNFVFNH